MKIFLDSANLTEITMAMEQGLIDGVTTNPSLIAKEGTVDLHDHILRISELVPGPVNAEVIGSETDQMVAEGRQLASIADNVVVKIPMTLNGLQAVKQLAAEQIKTNVTLVFSLTQGLLAAKAGATYVSPFVGRLDDIGQDGIGLIQDIVNAFRAYGYRTEVLAASIRSPQQAKQAVQVFADVATLPYSVLEAMTKHPLTDAGLEKFMLDWRNRPQ